MSYNLKHIAICLVLAGSSVGAFAQDSIKLIVPFAAGGGVDVSARLIARQLQTNLGVVVIVENRPGASGTVGGKAVQMATPDGATLLYSASTHVLAKQVLATAPYDPATDFAPVARVAEAPLLMVIAPHLPPRTVREVMDAAKREPAKWTAALPALGAASHIGTLMFANQGGLTLTTAAYRGTAPALTDVAGGHTQILIDSIISLWPMAKEGRVRPIATTGSQRSGIAPNVPTAAESGFPKLVYTSWYGVWAPKGTPAIKVQALNSAINKAVSDLSRSGAFTPLGIVPVFESPAQFASFIEGDIKSGAALLTASGFKPE